MRKRRRRGTAGSSHKTQPLSETPPLMRPGRRRQQLRTSARRILLFRGGRCRVHMQHEFVYTHEYTRTRAHAHTRTRARGHESHICI